MLILAQAVTGATGFALAGSSTNALVTAKKHRMPIIAAIGLLALVPASLYLAFAAARNDFGAAFYCVQAIELAAGAANLTLMDPSMRDGTRLTSPSRRRQEAVASDVA